MPTTVREAAGLRFRPDEWIGADAVTRGETVVVQDIDDPRFTQKRLARAAGFEIGVVVPVRVGAEWVGAMTLLGKRRQADDPLTRETIGAAAAELGPLLEVRRANDQLRAEEGRFRALTEGLSDVVVVVSVTAQVLYASPAFETLLDLPPDALLGTNLGDRVHPRDLPSLVASAQSLITGETAVRRDLVRMRKANGQWVWVEGDGRDHRSEPSVGGLVLSLRDVTERVLRERTAELAARFSAVAQQEDGDEAFLAGLVGAIGESAGWDRVSLWEPRQADGALVLRSAWHRPDPALDAFHRATLPVAFAPGEGLPGRAFATGAPLWSVGPVTAEEFPWLAAAKEAGLLTAAALPVASEGGRFRGVLMLFEREAGPEEPLRLEVVREALAQAEPAFAARASRLEVAEREEWFRALTEGLADAVIVRDEQAITYASPAVERLLGIAPASLVGTQLTSLIHPGDREWALGNLDRIFREGLDVWSHHFRVRHADGTWRWIRAGIRNESANPVVRGLVLSLRDVTDEVVRERSAALLAQVSALSQSPVTEDEFRLDLLEAFCEETGWVYGEWWQLAADGGSLVHGAAWYEPTPELDRFHAGSLGLVFRRGEGMPGRTWQQGGPVWNEDVASQRLMRRPEEAVAAGLRAALGVPLTVNGAFAGVLLFFDDKPSRKDLWRVRVVEETVRRIDPFLAARAARQATEASERRFRALTENDSDVVVILDRDLVRTYVSPSIRPVLGLDPEAMTGKPFGDTWRESGAAEAVLAHMGAIAGTPGGTARWENETRTNDGRPVTLEHVLVNYLDDPAINGWVWTLRDVTVRKRAERAVANLAAIVTSTPTAILSADPCGTVLTWNPGAERLFGATAEQVTGRRLAEVVPVLGSGCGAFERALAGEAVDSARVRHTTAAGEARDLLVTTAPITREDGTRLGVAVLARDITDLTEAQRQREEALARERTILDATAEGFCLVAPDRTILTVNRRFAQWLGTEPEALVGQSAHALDHFFRQPLAERARLLGSADDPEGIHVATLQTREASPRDIAVYTTPIRTEGGEHVGRLSVYRHVTAESEAARVRDETVAHMMHELRTPLAAIKGYADLLLLTDVRDPEEDREFVGVIASSATRMMRLVDNVLDLAHLESGEADVEPEPVSVGPWLRSVAASLAPVFAERDQAVVVEADETLPQVWAGPDRLDQILGNLLSNASKYTLPGGRITVSATLRGRSVAVSVADTGVGMTPAELERLFTKFFRARNKVVRSERGTGLGLVITRSLVNLLGGELSVSSQSGVGSTFTFTVPVAPEPAPGRRGPILVVEDVPEVADLTERRLAEEGWTVLVADTGEDGLALAASRRPRLVVLDLGLPGISGYEVLEALKADPATADIPVIVYSATPDPGRTRRLGAVDTFAKTVDEATFLRRVRAVLRERGVAVATSRD